MFKRIITMVSILVVLFSATLYADTVQLPRSGQTTCYSAAGAVINCFNTGQAGDTQTGAAWPNPRFTNPDSSVPVSGDVVTDQLTGLMWTRNANLPAAQKSWQQALDYVALMNTANNGGGTFGYNDWRLPNINELLSLMDLSRSNPALPDASPFTNVVSSANPWYSYWSSDTSVGATYYPTSYVIMASMFDGSVIINTNGANVASKSYFSVHVWPVRGGI